MRKISAIPLVTGAALLAGALVQIYYSDLSPHDPWSALALLSSVVVMLLNWTWLFF